MTSTKAIVRQYFCANRRGNIAAVTGVFDHHRKRNSRRLDRRKAYEPTLSFRLSTSFGTSRFSADVKPRDLGAPRSADLDNRKACGV